MSISFEPLTSDGAREFLQTVGQRGMIDGQLVRMQFTGLNDKNGKEIYEGDIVKNGHGNKADIAFGEAEFYCREHGFHFKRQLRLLVENIEVIGNIYENPDLLSA
jgi:YopX protein